MSANPKQLQVKYSSSEEKKLKNNKQTNNVNKNILKSKN